MRKASEITPGELGDVSVFCGTLDELPTTGFVDCILAFPRAMNDSEWAVTMSWYGVECYVNATTDAIAKSRKAISGEGSLWVWAKDVYVGGGLAMVPDRIAMAASDHGKWTIRNEVAWECKVADPAPESRLKRSYEKAFHLATGSGYFYDRTMGEHPKQVLAWKGGAPSSKTGVVGSKYCKYINDAPSLTSDERQAARQAMTETFNQLNSGEISDYRVAIRGIHKVSGSRAKEVAEKGFSISKTKSHSLPSSDLWRDARGMTNKWIPGSVVSSMVRLACKPGGVVLDLFPSESTAAAVVVTGRRYVAVSTNDFLLGRIWSAYGQGSLFDEPREVEDEVESEVRAEDAEAAQEAVQDDQGGA